MAASSPGGGQSPPSASEVLPAGADVPLEGDASPVAQAIMAHAEKVLRPREYFSLSDWLAYGWDTKTRITIMVGSATWEVFDFLVPPHIKDESKTWSKHLHIVACRVHAPAMDWSRVNHWVYCLPVGTSDVGHAPEQSASLIASLSLSPAVADELVFFYAGLGYVVFLTVAQGDCGADTVCQSDGRISHMRPPLSPPPL